MAKRGQNEGSIYKRKDGRWAGAISLGYQNGKPKRKTFYGETRKEVQEKLTVALRDAQQGLPISTDKQTVAQFLDSWLTNTIKRTVRPRTFAGYEQTIRLHVKPTIGRILLQKLSPQHVEAMLNELELKGLGLRTVAYTRTVLRTALNQALKWGLVARNAASLVDPPRYKAKEISTLTSEEIQMFLEAIKDNRLETLYFIALALGLREGEALGLRWQDIDFTNKKLMVKFAIQRFDGKLQLVEPKTERSKRTLPLTEIIITSLRNHGRKQLSEKLLAGSNWVETDLVFTTTKGTPLDGSTVIHRLQKILQDAGLPKYRFHDLRHSCASLLLSQGVPARTIMEILGHSQINLTMNTYAHVMPEMKTEAISLMDNILNPSKNNKVKEGV